MQSLQTLNLLAKQNKIQKDNISEAINLVLYYSSYYQEDIQLMAIQTLGNLQALIEDTELIRVFNALISIANGGTIDIQKQLVLTKIEQGLINRGLTNELVDLLSNTIVHNYINDTLIKSLVRCKDIIHVHQQNTVIDSLLNKLNINRYTKQYAIEALSKFNEIIYLQDRTEEVINRLLEEYDQMLQHEKTITIISLIAFKDQLSSLECKIKTTNFLLKVIQSAEPNNQHAVNRLDGQKIFTYAKAEAIKTLVHYKEIINSLGKIEETVDSLLASFHLIEENETVQKELAEALLRMHKTIPDNLAETVLKLLIQNKLQDPEAIDILINKFLTYTLTTEYDYPEVIATKLLIFSDYSHHGYNRIESKILNLDNVSFQAKSSAIEILRNNQLNKLVELMPQNISYYINLISTLQIEGKIPESKMSEVVSLFIEKASVRNSPWSDNITYYVSAINALSKLNSDTLEKHHDAIINCLIQIPSSAAIYALVHIKNFIPISYAPKVVSVLIKQLDQTNYNPDGLDETVMELTDRILMEVLEQAAISTKQNSMLISMLSFLDTIEFQDFSVANYDDADIILRLEEKWSALTNQQKINVIEVFKNGLSNNKNLVLILNEEQELLYGGHLENRLMPIEPSIEDLTIYSIYTSQVKGDILDTMVHILDEYGYNYAAEYLATLTMVD